MMLVTDGDIILTVNQLRKGCRNCIVFTCVFSLVVDHAMMFYIVP